MAGQDVFKFAVRSVPGVIEAALKQAGLEKDQVDWLVMHQANQRILDAAATRLGLPAERVREGGVEAEGGREGGRKGVCVCISCGEGLETQNKDKQACGETLMDMGAIGSIDACKEVLLSHAPH